MDASTRTSNNVTANFFNLFTLEAGNRFLLRFHIGSLPQGKSFSPLSTERPSGEPDNEEKDK